MSTERIIKYFEEVGVDHEIFRMNKSDNSYLDFLIESHKSQREQISSMSMEKFNQYKVETEYFRRKELDESIDNLFKTNSQSDYFIIRDVDILRDGGTIVIRGNSGNTIVRVDKDYTVFKNVKDEIIEDENFKNYIREALTYFLWKKENDLKILRIQVAKIRSIV